jgi:sugar lactone lactonase YvrE
MPISNISRLPFLTIATLTFAMSTIGVAGPASASPTTVEPSDITVFAPMPKPGSVALTVVGPDHTIYGGTYFPAAGNAGDGTRSRLFAWSPSGALKQQWTIRGENLSADHGVQATSVDRSGRIYLLDASRGRVLRLDPRSGRQTTYGNIPDFPSCGLKVGPHCTRSLLDNGPDPDYAAWGPDGSLYITDVAQAAIVRVPPGGGKARLWLTDPRFDAVKFGLTGLALGPDRHSLYATIVGSSPLTTAAPANGALVRIPIAKAGGAGRLQVMWRSRPLEMPDGFAFTRSGSIYLALLGPLANQVVKLDGSGQQVDRFPSLAENLRMPIPFDGPSSVVFDGCRLLITNNSFFTDDRAHQVIFAVRVRDRGMPVYLPPTAN